MHPREIEAQCNRIAIAWKETTSGIQRLAAASGAEVLVSRTELRNEYYERICRHLNQTFLDARQLQR